MSSRHYDRIWILSLFRWEASNLRSLDFSKMRLRSYRGHLEMKTLLHFVTISMRNISPEVSWLFALLAVRSDNYVAFCYFFDEKYRTWQRVRWWLRPRWLVRDMSWGWWCKTQIIWWVTSLTELFGRLGSKSQNSVPKVSFQSNTGTNSTTRNPDHVVKWKFANFCWITFQQKTTNRDTKITHRVQSDQNLNWYWSYKHWVHRDRLSKRGIKR